MPHEITSRIRRDELLELLETEAPVTNQRTTAPMPAVTLTGLLCIREEDLPPDDDAPAEPPPPQARRMRANTVPAPDRPRVRAVGTHLEIKAQPTTSTIAEAAHQLAELLTRDVGPVVSRTLTPKTRRIDVPTDALTPLVTSRPARPSRAARTSASTLPPVRRTPPPLPSVRSRRTKRTMRALENPPLDPSEIASAVDCLGEVEPSEASVPPAPFLTISFASPPEHTALTTEQLRSVSLRSWRPLVIAASCTVTLLLALLISLL